MTILVTGAAGFIGAYTFRALQARGDRVVGIDNFNDYYDPRLKRDRVAALCPGLELIEADIADLDALQRTFESVKPSRVVHLAAQAGVRYSLRNPHAYVDSNVVGFVNILEGCRHTGVEHFVYASSSSIYGGNERMPFSEHDNVDHPVSLYAASKKANELMAHTYAHLFGFACSGLRFFTVYGPYGRPDMAPHTFVSAVLKGEPLTVYNNGTMKRDFTYVDDIVDGILGSLDTVHRYEVFNLGNHTTVELSYFIECIEKELGKKAVKNLLPMQPGDVPATWADIAHTKEKIGFEPKVKIEEGIHRFVKWYREYYKV